MRLPPAYLSIREPKRAPRFGSTHTEAKFPTFTLAELKAGIDKGVFTATRLKNTPGQTIDIYAPSPQYFKQPHVAGQPLNQFDVWYVEQQGTNKPVTKEAHDYDELYRYDGQIYEFLVHKVLKYNGHKVLAKTAIDLANLHGLNTANTVIVDMGAGHGPDLQELRKQGFKGKVFGLDICEAAKTAHYSKYPHDFLTHKYNDYYIGELSNNPALQEKMAKNPPDIFIVGSAPGNNSIKNIHSVLKTMKPNQSYFIMNIDDLDETNDKTHQYIEKLIRNGNISCLKSFRYPHRQFLNGNNFEMTLNTYKLLKPTQ